MDKEFTLALDPLWLGTEAGLQTYVAQQQAIHQRMSSTKMTAMSDDDDDMFAYNPNYLLKVTGETAIVNIQGPIKSQQGIFDQFFGAASYPAIRTALATAYSMDSVKRIVLNIDSPGGQVNGCDSVAQMVMAVKRVKPVYAVANGDMCSAAYWIGCSATEVFATRTASIGSIGVVMTHREVSEAMEKMGVKVTVLSTAKFKTAGTPYEPLTDESKAILLSDMEAVDRIFVDHVAEMRKKSPDFIRQVPGQGRVFRGQAALEVSLVDAVSTYDAIFGQIVTGEIDKRHNYYQNSPIGVVMDQKDMSANSKKTDEVTLANNLAAAALGLPIVPAPIPAVAVAGGDNEVTVDADPEAATTGEITSEAVAEGDAQETHVGDLRSENDISESETPSAFTVLTQQLEAKTEEVVNLRVEVQGLKAQLEAAQKVSQDLAAIVSKSVSNMSVALGGSESNAESDPQALLAEHNRLSQMFVNKFKAGGVAAATLTPAKTQAPARSSRQSAALAATKLA